MTKQHFDPTEQQKNALKTIKQWWKEGKRSQQIFYLSGYAGTGKTSLVPAAISEIGLSDHNVIFGAYTGKAALVLQQRGLTNAMTIHRMIYQPIQMPDGKVKFTLNPNSDVLASECIVLDECSMIDDKLAADLVSFGKPILVLGDPGQLPPIKGAGMFTNERPDVMLTEIHRQAADNPIIQLSQRARHGESIPFGDFGQNVRKVAMTNDLPFDLLTDQDQILTGKNATRRVLNSALKAHHGHTGIYPTLGGAKLICLRNQYSLGLLNGMMFNTFEEAAPPVVDEQFFTQSLIDEESVRENIPIYRGYFDGYEIDIPDSHHQFHLQRAWRAKRPLSEFDWGYAITVHKAQGSGWPSVLIYDDGFANWNADLRKKWLYTAVTRAESELVILAER